MAANGRLCDREPCFLRGIGVFLSELSTVKMMRRNRISMLAFDLTKQSLLLKLHEFPDNPCLTCGACCTVFRVSFYWGEAEREFGGIVPTELTEDFTAFRRCMKGTNQKMPRCIALYGDVGRFVYCTIYDNRPSPCHQFGITFKDGIWHASVTNQMRCNKARVIKGLSPLTFWNGEETEHRQIP